MPTEPIPTVDQRAGPGFTLTAAESYRRLCFAGFSERQAASLVARLAGLAGVPGGWTITEVERLLFVRAMVDAGRLGS